MSESRIVSNLKVSQRKILFHSEESVDYFRLRGSFFLQDADHECKFGDFFYKHLHYKEKTSKEDTYLCLLKLHTFMCNKKELFL